MKTLADKYQVACAAVGLAPNSFIAKGLLNKILHIRVEKIQPEEWKPIIKCLENDSFLVEVFIENSTGTKSTTYPKKTRQPSFCLAVKMLLFKSLASCLMCSSSITKLSIVNIPLKKAQIELLSRGLAQNKSLQYLCTKGSLMGHKSFNNLFPVIRKCLNINHLDFTQCKLNEDSCSLIGCLLRSQILERHTETWKQSLRYNVPDVNGVAGIKRLTLNGNPIGDNGCEIIATALQDDYWVRAIDLQQCNISDEGAKMFLILLEDNGALSVLDLRSNNKISDTNILSKIETILKRNAKSDCNNYENGEMYDLIPKAPKSKSLVRKSISNLNMRNSLNESRSSKTPKTPKRPTQYENYYNSMLKNSMVKHTECLNDIDLHDDKSKFSPILVHRTPASESRKSSAAQKNEQDQIFNMLDELKNDLEVYKNDLYREKERSQALELKVNALERENMLLRNQTLQKTGGDLETELLETIETSFSQFHNFLDMLKQAGYGDLCQLINK